MERSRNQNLLPMKGVIERETRQRVAKIRLARLAIQETQQNDSNISPIEHP